MERLEEKRSFSSPQGREEERIAFSLAYLRLSDVQTIFTLASGRSGTHFLYEIIRRNAVSCVARHETYGFNPSMFGRPIFDHAMGNEESIRRLLDRKCRIVNSFSQDHYLETSHAFLKSWFDLAPEFFPRLKLVHLIRDPLYVAKSEATREELIKKSCLPFCHYRAADGQRCFLWSLTGQEPIFQHFASRSLTRLQWYIIQWIEIENRAMRCLAESQKHGECFTLESPRELNCAARMAEMFEFLGLEKRHEQIAIRGRRNKNWWPTVITEDDRRQLAEAINHLPSEYLEIFQREPYARMPWIDCLSI